MRYKVLIHITNDRTSNQYDAGEEVDNDVEKFGKDVIDNWLDIGVLKKIGSESVSATKPKRRVTLKGKSDK